jgi:splicing factor 45
MWSAPFLARQLLPPLFLDHKMSSKAGGLYGGIQFSTGTTFSSSVVDVTPTSSTPVLPPNEPDVPVPAPTQPTPMLQEQPMEPGGASGKATAGIFSSATALKA